MATLTICNRNWYFQNSGSAKVNFHYNVKHKFLPVSIFEKNFFALYFWGNENGIQLYISVCFDCMQ